MTWYYNILHYFLIIYSFLVYYLIILSLHYIIIIKLHYFNLFDLICLLFFISFYRVIFYYNFIILKFCPFFLTFFYALEWSGGQPDNAGGTEHCVHFWQRAGGLWNDLPCNFGCFPVCELTNLLADGELSACLLHIHHPHCTWLFTTEWLGHQPDNSGGKEDCVQFWTKGRFNDHRCSTPCLPVCELHSIIPDPSKSSLLPIWCCLWFGDGRLLVKSQQYLSRFSSHSRHIYVDAYLSYRLSFSSYHV